MPHIPVVQEAGDERRRTRRLERPGWRDLRLVVGVLLVLLSVAGGARLFAALDDSSPVYAAARDLLPGQPIAEGDLVAVPVQLGESFAHYVDADRPVVPGTYLTRGVPAGELVPVDSLGTQREALDKTVSVLVDGSTVSALGSGSVVDVWVSRRDGSAVGEAYLDPELLLAGAIVDRVSDDSAGLGPALGRAAVAVVVPADRVGEMIAAVDQEARVTLVPAPRELEEPQQ